MYKTKEELKANIKTDFPKLTDEQYKIVISAEDKPFTETYYREGYIEPTTDAKKYLSEPLDNKDWGGYTYFTFDIKGEPHVTGRGKMHYVLYKHSIPRVAKKVIKKLDKNARTSYEKFDYPGESTPASRIERQDADLVEEVFAIPITPAMKEKLTAQGGISHFGYAEGGLVKTLQGRIAKRKGGQIRNYKKEYANYQSRPEQKKNRAKRNAARRSLLQSGRVHKGDGKDVDHKDGNPQNNSPNNLLVKSKSNNRSFSRKGYGKGGDIIKNILTRRLGVPEEIFDKQAVWDQSDKEWLKITEELIAGGMKKEDLPSSAGGRNALNHLIHTGIIHRAYPDREGLTSFGLEAKEMGSSLRYSKPLEGKLFVGVRDSSTDSWNNKLAYRLAKIDEGVEEQARRRMDTVKDSIMKQHAGQPLEMAEDAMFFDYAADEYYHK